jgi:hypothetical protein
VVECPDTGRLILQPVALEVLAENWTAVQVFQCCQPTFAGMSGTQVGISAAEIEAAMRGLRIAPRERPDVMRGVVYMGRIAADEASKVAKKEPKR